MCWVQMMMNGTMYRPRDSEPRPRRTGVSIVHGHVGLLHPCGSDVHITFGHPSMVTRAARLLSNNTVNPLVPKDTLPPVMTTPTYTFFSGVCMGGCVQDTGRAAMHRILDPQKRRMSQVFWLHPILAYSRVGRAWGLPP